MMSGTFAPSNLQEIIAATAPPVIPYRRNYAKVMSAIILFATILLLLACEVINSILQLIFRNLPVNNNTYHDPNQNKRV